MTFILSVIIVYFVFKKFLNILSQRQIEDDEPWKPVFDGRNYDDIIDWNKKHPDNPVPLN